jgi:hypothetical protein
VPGFTTKWSDEHRRPYWTNDETGQATWIEPVQADKSTSEKDARLAQKLGQLQPFIAVFPQECMG